MPNGMCSNVVRQVLLRAGERGKIGKGERDFAQPLPSMLARRKCACKSTQKRPLQQGREGSGRAPRRCLVEPQRFGCWAAEGRGGEGRCGKASWPGAEKIVSL